MTMQEWCKAILTGMLNDEKDRTAFERVSDMKKAFRTILKENNPDASNKWISNRVESVYNVETLKHESDSETVGQVLSVLSGGDLWESPTIYKEIEKILIERNKNLKDDDVELNEMTNAVQSTLNTEGYHGEINYLNDDSYPFEDDDWNETDIQNTVEQTEEVEKILATRPAKQAKLDF